MLGCKVDKIFLRAPLVFMKRRVPLAPMDARGRHLWQLTVGRRPLGQAMRQRILGSHTPLCHGRMVITTLSSMFALLHCSANRISADYCLACATPGGYRMFFGRLGQLAPTTLPQPRLVSNLSLCGPLSLCVLLPFRPPKGVCLTLRPPKGVSLPLRPPDGFLSGPLFPFSLPHLSPPSACPCNSGVPPFARRRVQQRVP